MLPNVSEFYIYLSTLFSPLKVKEFVVLDFVYVAHTTYTSVHALQARVKNAVRMCVFPSLPIEIIRDNKTN